MNRDCKYDLIHGHIGKLIPSLNVCFNIFHLGWMMRGQTYYPMSRVLMQVVIVIGQ